MADLIIFPNSRMEKDGVTLFTGRHAGRDVLVARGPAERVSALGLAGAEALSEDTLFPASYENMLIWDGTLAPSARLRALNHEGFSRGFGAGNRMVISQQDVPLLRERTTFGGWDGIFRGMEASATPFWFVQQSIVRELIPEGVDPADYPGIGHTGGYGPRELLRAGLFAFASLGGYTRFDLPIGADADHAIVTGYDEESLAASLAFNKLAIVESRDYTKFTVDTSHLFDFPVTLTASERHRLLDVFQGRTFDIANVLPDQPALSFRFDEDEILRLGKKYWRACAVHQDLYAQVAAVRGERPFDYELSLDETPEPTPPRDQLFYMVLLQEVMGVPEGGVASSGPNLGFIKRHDYEGTLEALWPQVNASASILAHFGAMLSVHSADGVRASTGKGPGVDEVLASATGGDAELKVADVYQEILWEVLESSPDRAEREIFSEVWRRTYEAAANLGRLYRGLFHSYTLLEAQRLLKTPEGKDRIAREYGVDVLELAQGGIGYGLPLFRLAANLVESTDPNQPTTQTELFRRFMFLPYRGLRPAIFQTMTDAGWERLADAIAEATLIRLRPMHWTRA